MLEFFGFLVQKNQKLSIYLYIVWDYLELGSHSKNPKNGVSGKIYGIPEKSHRKATSDIKKDAINN